MPPQLVPVMTAIANTVDRHTVEISFDHKVIVALVAWNAIVTVALAALLFAVWESKNSK